ncbi:MAG: T9SS type A sorting domain-containing protein, partial [Balneolales bacterium]|nr:T9SS type A sorting domain-containing protein [Balneolales bacterium]
EIALTQNTTVEPVFESVDTPDPRHPVAHVMASSDFEFAQWDENNEEGVFPTSMVFLQSAMDDPGLFDEVDIPYFIPFTSMADNEYHSNDADKIGFPYKLTGRTRLNGLGDDGISLINTGRGRDLGAVVAAIDTRAVEDVYVSFLAGTLIPNSRAYNLRLQYRVGTTGNWIDVLDASGNPVEYKRNATAGHTQRFNDISLPEEAVGQPYVQVRWKHYFTGERLSADSGARDMLRLDDIAITSAAGVSAEWLSGELPQKLELDQNYPNPFNPTTTIRYRLNESTQVRVEVYTVTGQRVAVLVDEMRSAGEHQLQFDASRLSSGVYIYRIQTPQMSLTRKMTLLK